jgi:antitoxin MazE
LLFGLDRGSFCYNFVNTGFEFFATEIEMRAPIRRMGNSSGVILPKPILAQLGVEVGDDLELSLEDGPRIVLVPSAHRPRAGWAEVAQEIAATNDDVLVWPEFGNEEDAELIW